MRNMLGKDSIPFAGLAEEAATHLEEVQWAVRPAHLCGDPPMAQPPVYEGSISLEELRMAIKSLRSNKTSDPDAHPLEFWRSIVTWQAKPLLRGICKGWS